MNWSELIESKKGVRASDQHLWKCDGSIYIVSKSKVDHYDGNDLYLNITRSDMILNFDF